MTETDHRVKHLAIKVELHINVSSGFLGSGKHHLQIKQDFPRTLEAAAILIESAIELYNAVYDKLILSHSQAPLSCVPILRGLARNDASSKLTRL